MTTVLAVIGAVALLYLLARAILDLLGIGND